MDKQNIPEGNIFKVFSQKLCGWFMLNGFKMLGTRGNTKKKEFNVFLFEKTTNLLECKEVYDKNKDLVEITIKRIR